MRVRYKNQTYIVRPTMLISVNVRAVFSAGPEKNWQNATVIDILGSQFTAILDDDEDENTRILMYGGIGETWKPRI